MAVHGGESGFVVLFRDGEGDESSFFLGNNSTLVGPGKKFYEKFLNRCVAPDDEGPCREFIVNDVVSPVDGKPR